MRKFLTLALALMLVLSSASALADITLIHNKTEIAEPLTEYAAAYSEAHGYNVQIISAGGSIDYETALKAQFANEAPDIFAITGASMYESFKEFMADQTGADWTQYTSYAYIGDNGEVVGFPVSIEGYGMAYNADILAQAGIDPATLTNVNAFREALEKLDSMKDELGLDACISMVSSSATGMTWVTGEQNFNVYLSAGLEYDDKTYIDMLLEGKVDEERFHAYCEYVGLIFQYSDKNILVSGTQDQQLTAFTSGKTAFYHQGNWMDPNIQSIGVDFEMGYIPFCFLEEDMEGIMISAPSWYVINKESENYDECIEFLNSMVTTEEGHNYMLVEAAMIPAYTNVEGEISSPLSAAVMEWNLNGKNYAWNQYEMPSGFPKGNLAPIYELLASGSIDVATFETMMINEIAKIPSL